MRQTINYFRRDELTKYGSIMFISSIITGTFNYIYHIYMGRVLGPEEYGTFGALFAIFYMIGIISQTLSTSTTRFISKFIGEGKEIGFFIKHSVKYTIIIGMIISIIFLLLSNWLKDILKLADIKPILVLIFILFLGWISPIMVGSLRGIKKFPQLGFTNISNSFFKLIFGIIFVTIGFGVAGALMGIAIGMLFALIISIIFIKPYIKPNNPHDPDFKFRNFYLYSIPVLLAMISYSIPSNLDVILVKYFFSPIEAGLYTSISIFGKIVFFFSNAIGMVMFPIVAEKYAKKENTKNVLKNSLLYAGTLSGFFVALYTIFPEIIIKTFGNRYLDAANYIVLYGLGMFFFSLIIIIMEYHLAIKNLRYIVLFTGFTIIEVIMLVIYSHSIFGMIEVLLSANFIFLIISMVYTYNYRIIGKNVRV